MANPMTKDYGQSHTEQKDDGANKSKDGNAGVGAKVKEAAAGIGSKAKEAASAVGDMVTNAAGTVGSTVSSTMDKATSATGSGVKHLGESIREKGPSEGFLGNATRAVADTLEGSGGYLEREGFSGMMDDVAGMIRRNPMPAILLGIGLGFLIGRTLRS